MELVFDTSRVSEHTILIAIVGYVTVFISLLLLFLVFNNLPKLLAVGKRVGSRATTAIAPVGNGTKPMPASAGINGEVSAAIGAAIHQYLNELHDEENMVITLQKVAKPYSPWSSKIYSVINFKQ